LLHCARIPLETSFPNTIENNWFASSAESSLLEFTLFKRNSSLLPNSPLFFPGGNDDGKTLTAAAIRFSAAAAMSSLRRVLDSGESSDDSETAPAAASCGLLRFVSGVARCMLIRIAICKSSSSPRSPIPERIKNFKTKTTQRQRNPRRIIFRAPFLGDRESKLLEWSVSQNRTSIGANWNSKRKGGAKVEMNLWEGGDDNSGFWRGWVPDGSVEWVKTVSCEDESL